TAPALPLLRPDHEEEEDAQHQRDRHQLDQHGPGPPARLRWRSHGIGEVDHDASSWPGGAPPSAVTGSAASAPWASRTARRSAPNAPAAMAARTSAIKPR